MASDENGLHIMTDDELAEQQAHYDEEIAARPQEEEIVPEAVDPNMAPITPVVE